MRPILLGALLLVTLAPLACDEHKYDAMLAEGAAPAADSAALAKLLAAPSATASAAPTWKKRLATDCKPHPATVDFGDDAALEAEVRKKVGKDAGGITPADLAQVKSINLSTAKVHFIDPCVFPTMTAVKDVFLGPGEYDDLTPLQKLTNIESLRLAFSQVKDLHAIEGLKKMDRLDLSHTQVGDEELKTVGSLVNVTELMLDEDNITDITPVSNLKKLERLSIKKTAVKSLAPIGQIKTLRFVYIADTPISDITPVQSLIAGGMKLIKQ
jgi:internalin A